MQARPMKPDAMSLLLGCQRTAGSVNPSLLCGRLISWHCRFYCVHAASIQQRSRAQWRSPSPP